MGRIAYNRQEEETTLVSFSEGCHDDGTVSSLEIHKH
jgi:hypothetical protein